MNYGDIEVQFFKLSQFKDWPAAVKLRVISEVVPELKYTARPEVGRYYFEDEAKGSEVSNHLVETYMLKIREYDAIDVAAIVKRLKQITEEGFTYEKGEWK